MPSEVKGLNEMVVARCASSTATSSCAARIGKGQPKGQGGVMRRQVSSPQLAQRTALLECQRQLLQNTPITCTAASDCFHVIVAPTLCRPW